MKLPLILLMNVLVAGTSIFVYDAVRVERPNGADTTVAADRSQLESRIESLEARMAARGPELRSIGPEDLAPRVIALEEQLRRLSARTAKAAAASASDVPFEQGTSDGLAAGVDAEALAGDGDALRLDEQDVKKVQALMREAERRRRDAWRSERLDRTLNGLEIDLSDEDKERLKEANQAFRTSVRDAFENARAEGIPPEEMRPLMETARAEFTTNLESFLPSSDAERLVQALSVGGGRRSPGGAGGPRGGSARGRGNR